MRRGHQLWTLIFPLLAPAANAQGVPPASRPSEVAQPADELARARARQHYEQGVQYANAGNYERGLQEFVAAYQSRPHFAVLYNIGQAYIALGRHAEAVTAIEQYLHEATDQVPPERLEQIAAQLALEKAQLQPAPMKSQGDLLVLCAEPVQIWVDGVPAPAPPNNPRIALDSGLHRVSLVTATSRSSEQRVALQTGAGVVLRCAELIPDAGAAAQGRVGEGPDAGASHTLSTVGYLTGGAGLALGGAALAHYFWNRGRYADWKDANSPREAGESASDYRERQLANNELASSIERASRVTVGLGVASGALLATGVTLLVLGTESKASVRPEASGAFGLSLAGVW